MIVDPFLAGIAYGQAALSVSIGTAGALVKLALWIGDRRAARAAARLAR